MKPTVLLIDLSALFHRAWHANERGEVSVAYEATVGGVNRCIAAAGPGALVAVCLDSKGNWRKELSPEYKSHREPLPPVFYAQFDKVKERLVADGLPLWGVECFEADDIIATATLEAFNAGHEVLIATSDKDMMQLVGEKVKILSTTTFEVRDASAVLAKFGVPPAAMGDWLSLVGDKSDGVKGAPGIGPKRAAELLNANGNLAGVFHSAYDLTNDMTPAIRKSLTENGDQIELARKLVTMKTDAPIRFEEIYEKREVKPLAEVDDVPHDMSEIEEGLEEAAERGLPELGGQALPEAHAGKSLAPFVAAEVVKPGYVHALEPRDFGEVLRVCKVLFNSRLYQKYKTPEAMAAVVMRGREMGYGAGASLDGFHVIAQTGQLAMHAHMITDRAMCHPDFEFLDCLETDEKHAIYEGKKKSSKRAFTLEYTIEQARRANLVQPRTNWETRPTEQLRKTCAVQTCRVLWPGAAMGLYSMVELGHDE